MEFSPPIAGPIYVMPETRAFVRVDPAQGYPLRVFGPKNARHPTTGRPCPACLRPFAVGDMTCLIPLGPGDDKEEQQNVMAGRPFLAVAVELHWACATGEEPATVEIDRTDAPCGCGCARFVVTGQTPVAWQVRCENCGADHVLERRADDIERVEMVKKGKYGD